MSPAPASHRRDSVSPATRANDLRQLILDTRSNQRASQSSGPRSRSRSRSHSPNHQAHSRRRSPSIDRKDQRRSRSRSRDNTSRKPRYSRSPDIRSGLQSAGARHRAETERRGRRGRSRSRSRSLDRTRELQSNTVRSVAEIGRDYPPHSHNGPSTHRNRERSYRNDRSQSPQRFSNGRERRGSAEYERHGRRASPTYDHYQPPRRDMDSGRSGRNRDQGTQESLRDRDGARGGGNGGYRGTGYDPVSRRDGTRSEQHRDDAPYRGGRRAQDQLAEFSNSRRDDRMAINFSIWAPSPTEEELRNRSPSPDREIKKKASKSKRVSSDDSDSDDSAGGRQHRHKSHRRSKEKKQSRSRHKGSSSKRSSGRSSKRRRRSLTPSSHSDEDERESKSRKSGKRKGSTSRSPSRGRRHRSSSAGMRQKENRPLSKTPPPLQPSVIDEMDYPEDMWVERRVEMPDDDQEVGPVPLHLQDSRMDERSYGGALLAGEGSAMAAYVQDGRRIPRRGEIGLESDQIEHYENAGFVMSGSRHQRMNAVRVRKENQVISAEEKRALMIFNQEEKIKKDNKIINEMREMVASKLRSTGHSV